MDSRDEFDDEIALTTKPKPTQRKHIVPIQSNQVDDDSLSVTTHYKGNISDTAFTKRSGKHGYKNPSSSSRNNNQSTDRFFDSKITNPSAITGSTKNSNAVAEVHPNSGTVTWSPDDESMIIEDLEAENANNRRPSNPSP